MRPRFKVSRAGLELIQGFEGLRRRAARLPDGRWTVGYGHTLSAREGAEVSEADAEALLLFDLLPVVAAVNDLVTAEIVQHQFDALAAFAFNIGVEAFAGSDVLKRVNEGRFTEAALALEVWRNTRFDGRSVTLEALVRRRAAEAALFLGEPVWPLPVPRELLRPIVDPAAEAGLPRRPPAHVEVDLDGPSAAVRLYEELVAEPAPEPDAEPGCEPEAAPEPAPEPAPGPAPGAAPDVPPGGFTAAQAEAVAQLLAPVEAPAEAPVEAEAAGAAPSEPPAAPPPESPPAPVPELQPDTGSSPEPPAAPEPATEPAAAPVNLASAAMSLRLHAPYTPVGGALPPFSPAPESWTQPEPTTSAAAVAEPEAGPPPPADEPSAAPPTPPAAGADSAPPPPVLVLTPLAEEPGQTPEPEPTTDEAPEPAQGEEPVQVPLFGPMAEGEAPRILVHETPEPAPDRGRWSDTGAFVGMGAVGLAALAAAIAAFQIAAELSPPAGQFDEKTGIAWALAIIGSLLVGVSAYHLFKRLGGVED